MSESAPIMIRAAISRDEWAELRALAVRENVSTSRLNADLLRAGFYAITRRELQPPITPKERQK